MHIHPANVGERLGEVGRWRDQQAFLELLQARARTEAEIQLLLGHFYANADARMFVVQALLRRLIEPQLIAAVNYAIYGGVEPWWEIDRRLDVTDNPETRLQILDAALANALGDPDGERRMLTELIVQGHGSMAVTRGLRLRDQGQMTQELALLVGELLFDSGGLVPDRAVAWERITVRWDGSAFKVSRSKGIIEAKTARAVTGDEAGEE
jgi:Ca-activated chloride channel homolog